MRFLNIFLCLSIALFFTSCATIINGPKTKIALNYEEGVTVKLDGKPIANGVKEIKVKSKDKHTIEMTKDGFRPVVTDLSPIRKGTSTLNLLGMGAGIPMMAAAFGSDNFLGLYLGGTGVMIAAPLVLYLVDGLTGSNFKSYPRSASFVSVKAPPMSEALEQYPIGCTNVNVRLRIGEKIGETSYKGKLLNEIFWENTVNVKAEDLEVIVNNGLKDLGFNVPDQIPNRGYELNAEITGVTINSDMQALGSIFYTCTLQTNWSLKDIYADKIVKKGKVESFNTKNSNSLDNVIYTAFDNGMGVFLAENPEIYDLVSKGSNEPIVNDFDNITLTKPSVNKDASIMDFTQSVVTVELDEGGHGSGFIISEDGYIMTNYHVVKNNPKVNVILGSGLSFIGEVIRKDLTHDVALIKLSGKGFKPLELLSNSSDISTGAEVYAIGTPVDKNLSQTVTKGILSGERLIEDVKYLQTDVSVSPGNSGGPIITKEGKVVGVVTSKVVERGVEGISFALPTEKALEVLKVDYK